MKVSGLGSGVWSYTTAIPDSGMLYPGSSIFPKTDLNEAKRLNVLNA
jgi:hypothetical protein